MPRVKLRSVAKINLDLRVLHKREDGFHELRTLFHTISLSDTIYMAAERSRKTHIAIEGNVEIPDNLMVRAAEAVLHAARVRASIEFRLTKRIPMGAGLGGGSSNAASVLLALPILLGKNIGLERLAQLGAELGSDVPYFLHGGAAIGVGRGTELYPAADLPPLRGVLATPGLHVSTAEAYQDLRRSKLTTAVSGFDTGNFESLVWGLGRSRLRTHWGALCVNDFEDAVFRRHPLLKSVKNQFRSLGASVALMSGSGSSVFGLFDSKEQAERAAARFNMQNVGLTRFSLVSRRRYRALWLGQLREHITRNIWPPQSRYAQK